MSETTNWSLRIPIILIAIIIASIFAVLLWYALAYLGMTLIIPTDYIAYIFSWMRIQPAVSWLIIGCFIGGTVGWVKSLKNFGRKKEALKVLLLATGFALLFCGVSLAVTVQIEKRAKQRALAEQRAREEEEVRKAREAEEKARLDSAWRAGKLWQVAQITNRTQNKVTFQLLDEKGKWEEFNLKPGAGIIAYPKIREIIIRFDYSYAEGYQERKYTLESTPVIGHEPTKADQNQSRTNYFQVSGNGIDLFH